MIDLKTLRKQKGYSRREVTDIIGMPYRTLENYEQGYRESPEWLTRLLAEKIENLPQKKES